MWWYFLPILWLIMVIFERLKSALKDTKGICVLGTIGSGKTTLFSHITDNYDIVGKATHREKIKEVVIKIGDRNIRLKETWDIGGSDDLVEGYYKQLIEDNDHVFIVFNLNDLRDSNKQINKDKVLEFQARLGVISRYIKKKRYTVIGSHLDHIIKKFDKNTYNKIKDEYCQLIGTKYLNELPDFNVDSNFVMLDLTDKRIAKSFIQKTFKDL